MGSAAMADRGSTQTIQRLRLQRNLALPQLRTAGNDTGALPQWQPRPAKGGRMDRVPESRSHWRRLIASVAQHLQFVRPSRAADRPELDAEPGAGPPRRAGL